MVRMGKNGERRIMGILAFEKLLPLEAVSVTSEVNGESESEMQAYYAFWSALGPRG